MRAIAITPTTIKIVYLSDILSAMTFDEATEFGEALNNDDVTFGDAMHTTVSPLYMEAVLNLCDNVSMETHAKLIAFFKKCLDNKVVIDLEG